MTNPINEKQQEIRISIDSAYNNIHNSLCDFINLAEKKEDFFIIEVITEQTYKLMDNFKKLDRSIFSD